MNIVLAPDDNIDVADNGHLDLLIEMQSVMEHEKELRLGRVNYRLFKPRFSILDTDFIFFVSRSAPYSFLEKALMPFDSEIWYWLVGFVAIGILVIVVVTFMSQKVQNFIFGLRVRAPMLNLM
jgi:hypothetical protein